MGVFRVPDLSAFCDVNYLRKSWKLITVGLTFKVDNVMGTCTYNKNKQLPSG